VKQINPARVVVRWNCKTCNCIRTTTLEKLYVDGPPFCISGLCKSFTWMIPFRTLIKEQHVHGD